MVAARKQLPETEPEIAAGGGSGGVPPQGPPQNATLLLLTNAMLTQVEIRRGKSKQRGIILNINHEDGTVDVQTDQGLMRHLPRYDWVSQPVVDAGHTWAWQWINAPEPEKPN